MTHSIAATSTRQQTASPRTSGSTAGRSADAYVIIVAWRFGYVPGFAATPPDGRSITEIELNEAQATGKPVLAFLLDPEAPWPPNRVDALTPLRAEFTPSI